MSLVMESPASPAAFGAGKKKKKRGVRTEGGVSFGGAATAEDGQEKAPRKRGISFSDPEPPSEPVFTAIEDVQGYEEEEEEEGPDPTAAAVAPSEPLNEYERFSDVDPALVSAASIFVQELMQNAQVEAQRRLAMETEPLLGKRSEAGKIGHDGLGDVLTDKHLRFIREEINKKCRRMYQVFLSCYGKLP